LVHYGQHHTFDDFLRLSRLKPGSPLERAVRTAFLFAAAYGFPFWLAQLLTYLAVPLAWRGLALALAAPVYIGLGFFLSRARREYAWPLYTAGYVLTVVGVMFALGGDLLLAAVLALDVGVYVLSAVIFRRSAWLYLANLLVPVVGLLVLRHLPLPQIGWAAGCLLGLAFLYSFLGRFMERWQAQRQKSGAGPLLGPDLPAMPFYGPGYLLSAIALVVATFDQQATLIIYPGAVSLYAISAWVFGRVIFLYPAAWLIAVPYYVALTLTPLPRPWLGLGWLPLIIGSIVLGRLFSLRGVLSQGSDAALPCSKALTMGAHPEACTAIIFGRSGPIHPSCCISSKPFHIPIRPTPPPVG
jgi:hypothetical protein